MAVPFTNPTNDEERMTESTESAGFLILLGGLKGMIGQCGFARNWRLSWPSVRGVTSGAAWLLSIAIAQGAVVDGLSAQGVGTAADSSAIMAAIQNWERGWEIYDPELAARDYSDEADWTNAFGMRRIGRDSIQVLLATVFRMSPVTAGRTQYEFHDLRFLSSQIALLRSRAIREGQQLPDGTEEVRRIGHLRVFQKRNDRWVIVSHLIADERTPRQPR